MKTTFLKRVFAMLAVVVLLVSMCSVSALAYGKTGDTTLDECSSVTDAVDKKICNKLAKEYGATDAITFATDKASDTAKYSTSLQIDGVQRTVYLSVKPSTGDVGVSMGDDGKLEIDGISSDDTSSWNQLFSRFKGIIVALTGVGTLVTIVLFIIQFMKLGASAGNPQARSQALTGVLWTGISAALLGSVTIIVGFFYNAI